MTLLTQGLTDYIYELRYGEKWFAENDPEKISKTVELLSSAECEVKIMVGELNPKTFECKEIISTIRTLLENEVSVSIVCNKNTAKKESAIRTLLYENEQLMELKRKFDKKLILYWQRHRARVHYCVVDKKHIRIDTPHPPYQGKVALFKYNTQKLAKEWADRFDKCVSNECDEITLQNIDQIKTGKICDKANT